MGFYHQDLLKPNTKADTSPPCGSSWCLPKRSLPPWLQRMLWALHRGFPSSVGHLGCQNPCLTVPRARWAWQLFQWHELPQHGMVHGSGIKGAANACVKVNSIRIGWFHSVSLHHISLDLPFKFIGIKQLWPWLRFRFTAPFRPSVCSAISKCRRLRLFWTSTEL